MTSRRRFLSQGSMTTVALLIAKPFTTLANSLAPVTGYSISNNSLVLAHTGNRVAADGHKNLTGMKQLKQTTANLLLLHAGNTVPGNTVPGYDASMHGDTHYSIAAGDYKIIYKADIKAGVITADDRSGSADRINELAVYLKKVKDCHLVVCLSQLGYKSKTGLHDLALAAGCTHIDIIIGGHAENFCTRPVIALNKNKEEVIINHAADNGMALRKIEIAFDGNGKKKSIAFTRTISAENTINNTSKI